MSSESPAPSRTVSRHRYGLVASVTALLALYWWLAVTSQVGKGAAYDETAHLTAGYTYWKLDDYRFHTENGNLPQRWAALPLLAMEPHFPPPADAAALKGLYVSRRARTPQRERNFGSLLKSSVGRTPAALKRCSVSVV